MRVRCSLLGYPAAKVVMLAEYAIFRSDVLPLFVVLGLLGLWSFTVGERAGARPRGIWMSYLISPVGVGWLVLNILLNSKQKPKK